MLQSQRCFLEKTAIQMKSPVHPGLGLKNDFAELGLSIAKAAVGLGVTRQQFHQGVNGQSAISPEMAVRLEKAIGSTADAWLRMQAANDLAKVRAREGEIVMKRFAWPEVA